MREFNWRTNDDFPYCEGGMIGKDRGYSPILIGTLIGVVLGCGFLFLLLLATLGICSDSGLSEDLFPYSVALDPSLHDRTHLSVAFLMALVQWPLYGMLSGIAWVKSRSRRPWLILFFIVLFSAHYSMMVVAQNRIDKVLEIRDYELGTQSSKRAVA